MEETDLRGETRKFVRRAARWLSERRRVPQSKPLSAEAVDLKYFRRAWFVWYQFASFIAPRSHHSSALRDAAADTTVTTGARWSRVCCSLSSQPGRWRRLQRCQGFVKVGGKSSSFMFHFVSTPVISAELLPQDLVLRLFHFFRGKNC